MSSHIYTNTPGLSHLWILRVLDRTGLSAWLLGFGCMLTLTMVAVFMLIIARYPDPDFYQNSVAFTAIISFFMVFYFSMGRGWYQDVMSFLEFDETLEPAFEIMEPGRALVVGELIVAAICALINININDAIDLILLEGVLVGIYLFYFIQYTLIVFALDIVLRQLVCLLRVSQGIRIDLLNGEFYSTLANVMVRHVGLYIFGVCIIALSYIVFTEGELSAAEMMLLMMPWYLPGLIIISLYLIPYNQFRKRIRSRKQQELNCIAATLDGNPGALDHLLLKNEDVPSTIDLLYYQDRIRAIKEWPFTDRIRALVLFGILPPLTWVIAALIEIMIEAAL